MTRFYNRPSETTQRQELRKSLPKAEVLLWMVLKGRQLEGLKFRRQYSVGRYVIDFYCAELKFGLEVDGDSHYTPKGKEHDKVRTEYLESFAITIVRVTNPDVYNNLEGVWEMLRKVIKELKESQSKKPKAPVAPPV